MDTVPPPPPPPIDDASHPGPPPVPQRNVGMLVLCYLGLLALIPLIVETRDRDVQWHARHGLVLFGAEVLFFAAFSVMCFVVPFLWLFHPLLWAGVVVLHIFAIMKSLNGQRLLIPYVSEYADKF